MPTALITGANRGIGLALAACYATAADAQVIAVTRDSSRSEELLNLIHRSGGRVRSITADISDVTAIARLAVDVADITIDLLINNAGVAARTEFGAISAQDLLDVFGVNSFAPLLLTQALCARLARGAKVVNITSVLGSMEAGRERMDALIYGMSKAALNMFSVKLANVLRPLDVAVLAIHPGGVQTRLGGSSAPLTAQNSAQSMLRVIDALDLEHSGAYLAYDGGVIPW